MPTDLLQLTTAFSGAQLIAFVYVVMELRHMSAAQKQHAEQSAEQAKQIAALNQRLSNVMGRLKISTEDN